MIKNIRAFLAMAALAATVSFPVKSWSMPAQTPASKPATKAPSTPPPTDAEIADAKSKGMVWVNTNTKVYHKSGDATYGKTKHGQFMTEADAIKGGNRLAKASPIGHKKTPAAGPSN